MGCRSRLELTVWQITLLVTLCVISVIFALIGWFRTPENLVDSHIPRKFNNVTAHADVDISAMGYLDDIGAPPLLNNPGSYVQFTFLHMNDVYELIPLSGGKKGGLARVATIRQLLRRENPATYTIIAGDLVSPSALGNSIVNGSMLNGKQMIATMNTLGVDFATLGNHEFDLKESSLRRRLNESKFEWIASNVYERNTNKPFHNVLPYKILQISDIKILIIGLTIDDNVGPGSGPPYVNISAQNELPKFTGQYIKYLRNDLHLKWDILICLTHVNMHNDIEIVEQNLPIDVVFGGHEHENYFLKRGVKYTPIYKADDNAFTVFIHRFAYQPKTKQLLIFSKLTRVSPKFDDEPNTAQVANYFYQAGLQAYRDQGYLPERVVCVLPVGMTFDGRSSIIRAKQTHLTRALCRAMMIKTNVSVCVFNSGAVRIDDQLLGVVTEYDVLRCLPFAADVITVKINGSLLNQVLNGAIKNVNTGMFASYEGVERDHTQGQWRLTNSNQLLDDASLMIEVVTIPYFYANTQLKQNPQYFNTTQPITRVFIEYLEKNFPKSKQKNNRILIIMMRLVEDMFCLISFNIFLASLLGRKIHCSR